MKNSGPSQRSKGILETGIFKNPFSGREEIAMKVKYVIKEYPVLTHFFGWYFSDKEEHAPKDAPAMYVENVGVKRLGKDILNITLDVFSHSWAGSQGITAWIIFSDGSWQRLNGGYSYSNNGRMEDGRETSQIWESFIVNTEISDELIQKMEAIVVNEWDDYDNPSHKYDDYTVYLRPRKAELREGIEREFRKELAKLTAVVEG